MTTACDLLSVSDLKECTLRALEKLGGAGTADEIAAEVCGMNGIDFGSGDYASPVRRRMRSGFEFDLGLARTALQKRGLLKPLEGGVWSLTDRYRKPKKSLFSFLRLF